MTIRKQINKQILELNLFMSEINKAYCKTDLVIMVGFPKTYQKIQNILRMKVRHLRIKLSKLKGTHTLKEWEELKIRNNNRCVICNLIKPLTKDHIIPICSNGSDSINNIQPVCKSCNSRKWAY